MSNTYAGGPITVTKVGFTAATAVGSASTLIPIDSAGNVPRYIRVAATGESYVKLGAPGVTATTGDILIQPADSLVLTTNGCTTIAYIQGAVGGKVNVTPMDNC